MAIPSTSNLTEIFVTRKPAWEAGVSLEQLMSSSIFASRSGLEQRQQRTGRGRWKMTYRAFLSWTERKERGTRAAAEIAAPLIVPFWTEAGLTASTMASDTVSIDRAASDDFFAPYDWILFDSPTQGSQFRQIIGTGTTDQELILEPMMGDIDFDPLTVIYPCRSCVRAGGQAEFEEASEITHTERLTYLTI